MKWSDFLQGLIFKYYVSHFEPVHLLTCPYISFPFMSFPFSFMSFELKDSPNPETTRWKKKSNQASNQLGKGVPQRSPKKLFEI